MRRWIPILLALIFTLTHAVSGALAAQRGRGVSEEAIKRVEAALPEKAPAKPAQPRKMLVFSKCWGFRHGAIGIGKETLEMLGEKTGAYEAVLSDDEAMLTPEKLAAFDAVCINNATTGKAPDEIVQVLTEYVKGGKGIVGIHAATDGKLGAVFGGFFSGHPWHEDVGIKVDDPDHPINQAFQGKNFIIKDEIYQFNKGTYSRDKLRVLLSLDMDNTRPKGKREDQDYGVSWVRTLGKGRVFYCSLGHRDEIFWNPAILQHYLAGIQYALGDLKADATPSANLPKHEGTASKHEGTASKHEGTGSKHEGTASKHKASSAEGDWKVLFGGKDLRGWMSRDGKAPGEAWVVQDEALVLMKKGPDGRKRSGGDIWTKQRFDDFVLDLEVKTWGNSGIFIRTDDPKNCVQTGIEIQVERRGGPGNTHGFGAVYDCLAPSKEVGDTKGGEPAWHPVRITCKDNRITVAIDGEQVIDMDLNRWDTPRQNPDGSKNKFARALKDLKRDGHIGFQDHGANVMYRNVRVREL